MKKMILNINILAALLMAGAAFTACSSSDDMIEQPVKPTEPQVYTMVIKASKGSDATTRALKLNEAGNGIEAYWTGDEKIDVVQYDETTEKDEVIGTATAAASGTGSTTITATLTKAPVEGRKIKFYLNGSDYDYTGQVGLLTGTEGNSISEKYDYANAYIDDFTVDTDAKTVTPGVGTTLNFAESPQQAIFKFTLVDKDKSSDAEINATKLNLHNNNNKLIRKFPLSGSPQCNDITITPAGTTNVIYAALSCMSSNLSDLRLTARAGDNVYSYTKSDLTIVNGKYYDVTVKMSKILTRLNSGKAMLVLHGEYKAITEDEAKALAMECWRIAGGTVYVVYSASGTIADPNVSYASMTGSGLATGTATTQAELVALYGEGKTAWFVEP